MFPITQQRERAHSKWGATKKVPSTQISQQSLATAKNWLKQGPKSKERARKKARKSRNMARVMKGNILKIFVFNTNQLTNKIYSHREIASNRHLRLDSKKERNLRLKTLQPSGQTTKNKQGDQ